MNDKPIWPADDRWWQHTPRTIATGYLTLGVAAMLLIWSGVELLGDNLDRNQTILFILIAICGVAVLFQSTSGIKRLLRQRQQ
jgi:hypothetical protein